MPVTSSHVHNRGDVLAAADQALTEAAEHIRTLSAPSMLEAGSTSYGPRSDRRATQVHAPIPINLDVLDYLTLAESELSDLVGEVLGSTGGHGDALGDGGVEPPAGAIDAVDVIRQRLPDAPDDVVAEVAAAVWRLTRTGSRLVGDESSGPTRGRCTSCGRRSVVPHPSNPGRWLCASRACRDTDQNTTADPSPARE
ncbi:hypothetical protein CLV30_12865 [Haloactinopolyspora alba]|uniref:Uncharacterized protein n=3 Tax=Haloactinopolyspora alba TaxID=648780 RepID=A0A2P8DF14_9ACTN|nr:hypothetical protein [Haloactinopolyspora alba]PSK95813.1 hypothetical protein CLV30_12865 [Haloactinopolyspora alba]